MKVSKNDGCKVLRASGKEEDFTGALTYGHIKDEIGTDLCEICDTLEGGCLVIDEEGKMKHRPFNPKATALYKYTFCTMHGILQMQDHIVGDVVYLPKAVRDRWDEDEQRLLALEDEGYIEHFDPC